MKIYAVIKQYRNEAPQISIAYKTMEDAQKHVDDILDVCGDDVCYKYYVQQSVVVMS